MYTRWIPESESKFEKVVSEHITEIFGLSSEYFDVKKKMTSEAGIASIPDAYLILAEDSRIRWYLVEIELSSHSIYDHVLPQVTKFKVGLKKTENRRKIVDFLHDEIISDPSRKEKLRSVVGGNEIHRFLNDTFAREPALLILVDSRTKELEEVINSLPFETEIIEFQTYILDSSLSDHIHQFEPFYTSGSMGRDIGEDVTVGEAGIVTVTLSGKRVRISKEDILRASKDSRVGDFSYVSYFVDLDGKKLPAKGLVSLATGIPTTDFDSPRARRILQKLGFAIRQE